MKTLEALLVKASRTFALTIPLLEEPLRRTMSVAYLLMRNADTLEDAWRVPRERRRRGLVCGHWPAGRHGGISRLPGGPAADSEGTAPQHALSAR